MILKILGFLDLASLFGISLLHFKLVTFGVVWWIVIYLLLKAFLFRSAIASYLDAAIAVFVIIMGLGISWNLGFVLTFLYLGQKVVVSFL